MDERNETQRPIDPRQTANVLSKLTFWYTHKLFKKGFRQELDEDDLYEVIPEFETKNLGDSSEQEWNKYKHQKKWALYLVLWNMVGKQYFFFGWIRIINIILNVVQPIIISKLVYFFTPNQTEVEKKDAFIYGTLLICLQVVNVISRQYYLFVAQSQIIKVRTIICALIYRKILRLPTRKVRHISFGKITSAITRDVNMFDYFFFVVNDIWVAIVSIIIVCYSMYRTIGLPALVLILGVTILIPIQVFGGFFLGWLKLKACHLTDVRVGLLQQALTNIRTIKMFVWEMLFKAKITTFRKKETEFSFKLFIGLFLIVATGITFYNVVFYLELMTFVWIGQQLTAQTIYFLNGAFISMSYHVSAVFPYGIFYVSQVIAAIQRVQTVLQDLEAACDEPILTIDAVCEEPKIAFQNVAVKTGNKVILSNVSFDLGPGLTVITGAAGSGKSVFLMSILKEFRISCGQLLVQGKISYALQEPWLFPSTIRQNILFGSKYDKKRYQEVIKACALHHDFESLENGDATIIADQGINLSKGQQSRINLARAVYKDCDIYLLDNCLSSLDCLVTHFIFVNCILNYLSKKTVILVTNNSNFLFFASNILSVKNGTVEISRNNAQKKPDVIDEAIANKSTKRSVNGVLLEDDQVDSTTKLIPKNDTKSRIYYEKKQTGSVRLEVYKAYVNLGGGTLFFLLLFTTLIATQLLTSYKEKLVSTWANLEQELALSNDSTVLLEQKSKVIFNYSWAVAAVSISTFLRAFVFFLFAKKVSVNLHKKMLESIFKAPICFFDNVFTGNIVNRFSKDLVSVDENIPFQFHHLAAIVFETIGNIVLIAITSTRFLIPAIVLFASFFMLRWVYLKTGRPLKRMDASTKNPVIGYLNSTLQGLLVIRTSGAEKILKREFEKHHNLYNSASYSHWTCLKAFVFAADNFISIFIAIVVFQFLIFNEEVLSGDFGIVITQAFIMGNIFFFALEKIADIETQMTSVERAIEYTKIQQEPETGLVLEKWPMKAEIKYENVSLSLNNSKSFILNNVTFTIKPMEKIGVVGRTGAGKSSIISSLFQLYQITGLITIGGVDIKTLSLGFLRSKISVIPQDSMVVNGSLRDNIDPKREQTDTQIWNAIETVRLKKSIPSLDTNIEDLNLTCGQKQLLGLARVLLKNNKILVLDEMVENVDSGTEELIYNIISTKFKQCTVIIIAHKLSFIMSCDKILVIDDGNVIEYDNPKILLQSKNSLFYKMVEKYKTN